MCNHSTYPIHVASRHIVSCRVVLSFPGGPCLTLESQPGTRINAFFHIQYSAYSPTISGTCLVQQAQQQQQGNFVAFISPPTSYAPNAIVGRDMVRIFVHIVLAYICICVAAAAAAFDYYYTFAVYAPDLYAGSLRQHVRGPYAGG